MLFTGNLAGIITPICIGLIVSLTGSYNGALMMFVGFGLLILLAALLLDFGKKVQGSGAARAAEANIAA